MMYQLLLLASAALLAAGHGVLDHTHVASTSQGGTPLRAVARLASPDGHDVHGNVTFTQEGDKVHILGHIYGMPPGKYGFHVHESGDITGGCLSTGAHFNPDNKQHGHPEDENRHVGDLGNIEFDNESLSHIDFYDGQISLVPGSSHNIVGRAVVLHAMADDFGRSDHPDSKKTGNAGGRIACGVIGIHIDLHLGAHTSGTLPTAEATAAIDLYMSPSPIYGWEGNAASSSKYKVTSIMLAFLSVMAMILQ